MRTASSTTSKPAEQRARWRVYALGGGAGHVVRSLALARSAAARGVEVRLLANSAVAAALLGASGLPPGVAIDWIPATADRAAVADHARAWVREPCDALVVDTFPRGLLGELSDLPPTPRAFVHRDLSPRYLASHPVREAAGAFDLLLVPGGEPPLADLPRCVRTDPWLLLDAGDLLAPPAARDALAPGDDRPIACVVATGARGEPEAAAETARALSSEFGGELCVVLVGASPARPLWPLLRYLRGVDVLIGAGGYNTVWEARSAGVPLVALPRERLYDRQARRLRDAERAADMADVLGRVAGIVGAGPRPGRVPTYTNGAHAAAEAIAAGCRPAR